jgi:hypothetical protein
VPSQFLSMLPYVATIVVLVLISRNPAWIRANMPASLGKPFFPVHGRPDNRSFFRPAHPNPPWSETHDRSAPKRPAASGRPVRPWRRALVGCGKKEEPAPAGAAGPPRPRLGAAPSPSR